MQECKKTSPKKYSILFPGISLCYKSIHEAKAVLQNEQEHTQAPRAIFKIQVNKDEFNILVAEKVTGNTSDAGILIAHRLKIYVNEYHLI